MARWSKVGGDGDPGSGAVGLSGARSVDTGRGRRWCDQGVPEPGAVVAGVDVLLAGGVAGPGPVPGRGEREQRGPQGGGVLDGAPAADPDPAGAVLERSTGSGAEVGGPVALLQFLLGRRGIALAFGVDHGEQVAGGLGQVGRGQGPDGIVEQQGLGPVPQLGGGAGGRRPRRSSRPARGTAPRRDRVQGRGAVRVAIAGRAGPGVGGHGGTPGQVGEPVAVVPHPSRVLGTPRASTPPTGDLERGRRTTQPLRRADIPSSSSSSDHSRRQPVRDLQQPGSRAAPSTAAGAVSGAGVIAITTTLRALQRQTPDIHR